MASISCKKVSADSCVVCSVCLEPYKGRRPKLLPCFHTFCLQCLTAIHQKAQRQDGQLPDYITCPTCRKTSPVPSEGVASFQANFYVDDEKDPDPVQPLLCDYCDDQSPTQFCTKCSSRFCQYCLRPHDTNCQNVRKNTGQQSKQCEDGDDANQKKAAKEDDCGYDTKLAENADSAGAVDNNDVCSDTTPLVDSDLVLKLKSHIMGVLDQWTGEGRKLPQSVSAPSAGDFSEEWKLKFDDLSCKVNMLQTTYTLLCQSTTAVNEKNARLVEGISTLQTKLKTLQKAHESLQKDNTALEQDHKTLQSEITACQDKNTILCQEMAQLQTGNTKLHLEVKDLQTDNTKLHQEVTDLQADNMKLHQQVTDLQADNTRLHQEVKSLQTDCTKQQENVKSLQVNSTQLQQNVKNLQTDSTKLQSDVKSGVTKVATLQTNVTTVQSDLKNKVTQLASLESKIGTACTMVAFHAILGKPVTTNNSAETLVCDNVIINVGGGYDNNTGVFTAPVTGTYIFMATAGAFNKGDQCRLDITYNEKRIGYLKCSGGELGDIPTGHSVVKLEKGERVWLKSYDDGVYNYFRAGWTSFTGALLQPQL